MSDPISGPAVSAAKHDVSPAWSRTGVLLLAHGAPDRLEDIPEFVLRVRGGRPLPEKAVKEISDRYEKIGGGSPLLRITSLQACGLASALNSPNGRRRGPQGGLIPVLVGMRNWKPFVPDSVRQLAALGVERIIAICLAPQNSRTSIGLYRKHLSEARQKTAPHVQVDFVESWHDQPELIAAFQEKISRAFSLIEVPPQAERAVPVILTAHSVPARTIGAGDPYQRQVRETAARVAKGLDLRDWCVAFQSQGITEEPWIGPTVESQIDRLAAAGRTHVLICPVGFVSDHMEVLYDIDVAFKEYGATRGVTVHRAESLNDSPLFVKALETLVRSRFSASSVNSSTHPASS
ncbi:MAG: ferrochelatase [Terriglobia bacterium]